MSEVLLGAEGKRKLRLRHKSNAELSHLYDAGLTLKHQSREARRVLGHFKGYLGEYPPSPELAGGFLAQFAHRKPRTLNRYLQMLRGFIVWRADHLQG